MIKNDDSYKFLNVVSSIILVIALFFILGFSYYLFIDDNPPIVINGPVLLDKNSYHAGEKMLITADICRRTDAGAVLSPTFINTTNNQLFDGVPVYVDNIPRGCSVSSIEVTVPHFLPPGIYVRQIRARYDINFLRTRMVEFTTEPFEITERIVDSEEG